MAHFFLFPGRRTPFRHFSIGRQNAFVCPQINASCSVQSEVCMMPFRTLVILFAAVTTASASSLTFTETAPVIGSSLLYEVFQVTLTQPTSMDADWDLSIQTNYPTTIPGFGGVVVPPVNYESGIYGMSDFLISWDGNDYGIVLTAHDGYTAGDLYEASGFQTSQDVLGFGQSSRPTVPVLLASGGSLVDPGTETGGATGGNGSSSALYTIDDQFAAPAGFLVGDFQIIYSSFVCANAPIVTTGQFAPEPGTCFLCLFAVFLLGTVWRRRAQA